MKTFATKFLITAGIVLLSWSIAPCQTPATDIALAQHVNWQDSDWNSGVNVKNTSTGFIVDIPNPSGHINIVRRSMHKIPPCGTITVTYRVTGQGKVISLDNTKGLAPNMRPCLFTGDWFDNNGRQWPTGANCMFLVPDGKTKTYSIKLRPNLWSNVQGKVGGLDKCTSHLQEFWFAFGGGNSFTHGLQCKGKMIRVEVLSVSITK